MDQKYKSKNQQVVNCLIGEQLNQDVKIEITSNFTEDELNKAHANTAFTCSSLFTLFKPNFKSELVNKLLVCAAWGQQDEVEKLLKTSPELMVEKTSFTDCSGRIFSNISAFEFLLWALDTRYMVSMMFDCLPKDEIGLTLVTKLKEQYDNHKKNGVTYTLEGKEFTENHFGFSVLINALQTHADNIDKWDWNQREKHWCNEVGDAQCYLPAHVMQHYFDRNVPFYPLPNFEAEQFFRTLKFYDYIGNKELTWKGITSSSDSVLDVNFGITAKQPWRGLHGEARGPLTSRGLTLADLEAITTLHKVRTADYLAIPSMLASLFEKKVAVDETPNSCVIL
jgi:hypothetical protein